jgi:hypothetical protein
MFDVFYSGRKPNVFAHERAAKDIDHARELSTTRYFWWINYLAEYAGFDFLWEPTPWQANQIHVWPSQWQENGGTMLVPKEPTEEYNRTHPAIRRKQRVPGIGIDHGNGMSIKCTVTARYVNDYLGTLRRTLSKLDPEFEFVWVVSSVCDYSHFDFSWHPSEWQLDMLHVFASDDQKFGDTFYIHVPSFLAKTENLKLLEWYDTLHFVEGITVPRKTMPVVQHGYDTHPPAVWAHEFTDPVVLFTVEDTPPVKLPAMNLWREETRTIMPLSPGASSVLVPREAKNHLKTQLYDYPYIDRSHATGIDRPLDIVYISNGEPDAQDHWERLLRLNSSNHIHWIRGVNGRVAAYQAAAKKSNTLWFFAVFAKLEISSSFEWDWQPDRLQEPKHYIFHAVNPVNGLVYGHQAMIAYNRDLVLTNTAPGLDFTLDQAHEVVPIISGTAQYHTSSWVCWRTAFRECIKLKDSLPNVENDYRLKQWLTVDSTEGQWSMRGAQDAVEYYDTVKGDFDELKKSYDWAWLASYAFVKQGLSPDQ